MVYAPECFANAFSVGSLLNLPAELIMIPSGHWALWDLGIYHFGVRTENLWSSSWDKAGVLTGFNRVDVRVDEYEPPKSRLTTIPFNGTMQQRRVADEDTFTNDHSQ